ncbi:helix-turn-helix transcriptional regulator [Kitasatospora sp. P5_F3]
MAPAPTLAERLAGATTDSLSVADIVTTTGLSESTVRRLTKEPGWPAPDEPGDHHEQRYPREACAAWMRDNQAARIDVAELPGADSDRVTITEIANRTGAKRAAVSPLPTNYKNSADPFPTADALGTYNWGEVKQWLGRRSRRTGPRGTTEVPAPAPAEAPTTTPVLDVLTTAMIERLTGRTKEAVKTLVRRPEIADLSSGKVGRSRVWPAATLLPLLWQLGYLPASGPLTTEQTTVLVELGYLPAKGKPTLEQAATLLEFGYDPKGSVEHRAWLAGPHRTATELAKHYGVTISAISQRISRAQKAGQPVPHPADTEDGKRYDPRAFDAFWNPPAGQ